MDRKSMHKNWWCWVVLVIPSTEESIKGNGTLEQFKIAGFAILSQFGAEHKKLALRAIWDWHNYGNRTGLHDEFGDK